MKKNFLISIVLLVMIGISAVFYVNLQKRERSKHTIGYVLPYNSAPRWEAEANIMKEDFAKSGYQLEVVKPTTFEIDQEQAVSNFTNRGIGAIILVVDDANSARMGELVHEAMLKGIPVFSYDRPLLRVPVSRHITIGMRDVGRMAAEAVFADHLPAKIVYLGGDPSDDNSRLHRDGVQLALAAPAALDRAKIVYSSNISGWSSAEAREAMKRLIGEKVDFDTVIAANDGIAGGAIEALKEAGRIAYVVGGDGDVEACVRIANGTQSSTVLKPVTKLAEEAVRTVVRYLSAEPSRAPGRISEVPVTNVPPVLVRNGAAKIDGTPCSQK